MRIAIGSDHAGFALKPIIMESLRAKGHEIIEHGCFSGETVDFPDIAVSVCKDILSGNAERAIMTCGTGVGAAIACNKIPGVRASVCHDIYSAHQCVEHDNVNVMCLGAQIIGHSVAVELVDIFLNASFSTDEDFRRRVEKLEQLDKQK